jgi:hypothetical protein
MFGGGTSIPQTWSDPRSVIPFGLGSHDLTQDSDECGGAYFTSAVRSVRYPQVTRMDPMHFVLRGYGTGSIAYTGHSKQLRKRRNETCLDTAKYSGLPPGTLFTLAFNGYADKTSKVPENAEASICLTSETFDESCRFSAIMINSCYLESTDDGVRRRSCISYDFEIGCQSKSSADSMLKNIISLKAALDRLLRFLASNHFEYLK